MDTSNWQKQLANVGKDNFVELALSVFRYQASVNQVYQQYIQYLGIQPELVDQLNDIPFLPIELFKSHKVFSYIGDKQPLVFRSSGTTGSATSQHFVSRTEIYEWSFLQGFKDHFGDTKEYCILGLLPSYLERTDSSLVYMVNGLINESEHPASGFYLNEYKELSALLKELQQAKQPTLLIGVTFALLDLAEQFPQSIPDVKIMETGGMKGRRKEMIRAALHNKLKTAFKVDKIYSEYGMTELLSQAYSNGAELFQPSRCMKILIRDPYDPFEVSTSGSGAINVIDLANIDSCSFIATSDLGRLQTDGQFEVLGRMDDSDIRGCNLIVQ